MRAISFRPPGIDPTPELRWVLHRAFGNSGVPVAPPHDPAAAFDVAGKFDLASRIGARTRPEALQAEVGPAANEFIRARRFTAASSLFHETTLHRVGDLATTLGIPLVVLKGCAIDLLGAGTPGARSFGDLDILVPLDRIVELRAALVEAGWTLSPLAGSEHQEAPLTHPRLGMIELHRCVPGVRPAGSKRSFDARTLFAAGLVESLPGFDGAVHAPSRTLLLAHALVHGLVQHGYAPGSYPLFRLLADLQDLGADAERLRDAGRFLRDVDSDDLEAIASLLAALESGSALELPAGPPRSLLHHLVAGSLDRSYGLGLKADPRSLRSPSDLPLLVASSRWVYQTVVLTRAQVDAIYGPPRRWGGHVARQLLRPFDLALRLCRSLKARTH